MEKHYSSEQEIDDIIDIEIAEHKSDLTQVESYIEEKFGKSLSLTDEAYIKRKYVEYCAKFWLQETTNFLNKLTVSKSRTVIQGFFNSLDHIQGLSQIPDPLNQLEYYTLLMKHYESIEKRDENIFVSRFKKECLEQIVDYSDSVKNELVFLETLVDFLSLFKSLQSLIGELKLEDFCRGDLSFDTLIDNILKLKVDTYGENLIFLQKVAEGLKEKADRFLIENFKEVIGAYIKPAEVREKRIDDRLVVEVTGNNIVVTEILQLLEDKLSEKSIEEVRFVSAATIHIDANLASKVWQGKNVVILTKSIKVYDRVTWNVSGKDDDHTYSGKADTGEDGHGKQGADGYPGKSGGNVLILVDKIENPESFTIISNGGRGSKGQDGGDGRAGDNGKSITKAEFDKQFPFVASFRQGSSHGSTRQLITNIEKNSYKVETVWCTGHENATIDSIIEFFRSLHVLGVSFTIASDEDIFIKTVSKQGNEITFSYAQGGFMTRRQAFFLYKGTLGQPGGHGGEYGLGGQGGYAGEITVRNLKNSSQECGIIKNSNQGEDGENGKGGQYGKHGKNGWDMGFMDYQVSEFFTEKWPKLFGTDQSSKCTIEYYYHNATDRVWCPYKNKYAKIIATKIENNKRKTYEERNNIRQDSKRQHYAQAVRNKSISQSSIFASYSYQLNSMERGIFQNLQYDLEATKQQALQAITENQEQQEKQTTELRITHNLAYQSRTNYHSHIFTTTLSRTCRDCISVKILIDKLKNETSALDDWFQLKRTEINFSQVSELFSALQYNAVNIKLKDIRQLLLNKYRFATLQNIAEQLPPYQEIPDRVEIMPEIPAKFLAEAKENDCNVFHDVLGTINQYLYEDSNEQREIFFKFWKEELQSKDHQAFNGSMRAFVLEIGESENIHYCIRQYYNKYKDLIQKQEHSSKMFFEKFKNELSQPRYAEVYGLWIECAQDKSLRIKLEEKIRKHNCLNVLYNGFNHQHKLEHDWHKCCKAVLEEHDKYILEKGMLSESYRELLAYVFGINIRLYVEDQDHKLVLRSDHNPSSKKFIHILCRDNKFLQLYIDEDYLKLEQKHKRDCVYAKIFAEIKPLKEKQELDAYLQNKAYLACNSRSENKKSFNEEEDIQEFREWYSAYQIENRHHSHFFTTTSSSTCSDPINVEILINKLKNDTSSLNDWFQLKNTELNLFQLNELFSALQYNIENIKLKDIEKLLFGKYRIATLQSIAEHLPPYEEITDKVEWTPEIAAKFLVEAKENDSNIFHDVLGTLNQYLYENSNEQREKVSKFWKEELQSRDCQALNCTMRAFVLEVGKSEKIHYCIKQYYDKYKDFVEKQERSLYVFFERFESEFSQPRYAGLFGLWMESVQDDSLRSQLEEKLKKHNFLNILYNGINCQDKQEYDWNECDKAVFEEHDQYIREKGMLSESYRELLAYVFGINIRLYVEGQDNKLFLRSDHNPSSKTFIHLLCRDNKFIQLDIDKNYSKLEEEQNKRNRLYAKIFAKIDQLKQKQEFDDYLQNKAYLACNSRSENKQSFNEEEDIEKIIQYFPEGERQQLKQRLSIISFQYIFRQGILHNIFERFSHEGRYVSSKELYGLIISILSSINEDRNDWNIFCWIVAAYPQTSWIDECILLELEYYFRKPLTEKQKWRKYLSKIENKDILLLLKTKLDQHKSGNRVSTECIEVIFHLLSNISNETISLEIGLELSEWSYALKEKYWMCKLSKLVVWREGDLPIASYYLLYIENIFGSPLTEKLIEALEKKKQELSSDKLTNILSYFYNERGNLNEKEINILISCSFDKWVQKMQKELTANKEERKITQLVKLIKDNANTSKSISDNLVKIEDSLRNMSQEKDVITGKPVGSFTEDDIKKWVEKLKFNVGNKRKDIEKQMLAVIERAIFLKKNIKLRDTQKLAVLALLTNDRSTLAQVSTGEGKSLIVVAASIMKALRREKVDIITSCSVLAKRDAEDNRAIFNLFGINVSNNCSEVIERRKEVYSGNQVVYGDLSNFQRDYLLDRFYGKNILGDRNFENVILDEVDSMLLDKGNNMLYLSHDLAGLDKLESVYIYIWLEINRSAIYFHELINPFDTNAIKKAVVNDLYGLVTKEEIGKLGPKLSEQGRNFIWERLIETRILDNQGKMLKKSIGVNELDGVVSPDYNCYKDRLHRLLKECIERERFICVPNHLLPFIEQHLESWINSAKTAFFMKAGEDYVVDVDKTGTSADRSPNITILDRDTGADQANSQWDEALHQFLQLKHGCKLSLQSLKAVFISNVSFFKLYSNLYGLTGTLGSQRERHLLQEIHGVDFVTIPTAKSKQLREDKPILCPGKGEWIERICNEVKTLTEKKKRSVLIICETVNDVGSLYKAFGGKNAKHVHTYTRDYEEFDRGFEIVKDNKELGQGHIIIATNLAGRGTDIKITEQLRKAGGLHVCLTYLPNNTRIEQQAFGRAARSGDPGSGQLIIVDSKGREYNVSRIIDLKKERDAEELHRISNIKAYYDTQITVEESCFRAFKEQYEKLKKDLDVKKVPSEVKEILLQSCLDKWAFWLDGHSKYLRELGGEQGKKYLFSLLDEFISRLKKLEADSMHVPLSVCTVFVREEFRDFIPFYDGLQALTIEHNSTSWLPWVQGNPVQMIKLGKYLAQNENHKYAHKNAIELFDKVIREEPYFSEAAHYYKAFALVKMVDFEQEPLTEKDRKIFNEFMQELRETTRLLNKRIEFARNASGIIGNMKNPNKESIIQIDAYEKQQQSLVKLYYIILSSIEDIFGHFITPLSFVNFDIDEQLAGCLYKHLLETDILVKPRVKKNITEEELKAISSSYEVSASKLESFLSKFKGKEINKKEFQKSLKTEIKLPGRNEFWKLLIQGEVLSKEVKCVVVNNKKLKKIDPSLLDYLTEKVKKIELEKQNLVIKKEQILLYPDLISQEKEDVDIFKNDAFIKIVGKAKYKVLKERGVLSFNRKAHINLNKIEPMIFPCYDSIALEDFTKVGINKSEAEQILEELVTQNVIEKMRNSENATYRLKIKFDEINQVHISFCPVYDNVAKRLLSKCFTYRIALQKIAAQLKENKKGKNSPVRLQLITKPHQNLISELLQQKFIRSATVATTDEDLEDKLKGLFSRIMTEANFKRMLFQSNLIPEEYIEELFDFLVKKKWITKYNPIQAIQDGPDLYYIKSPDKRRKPLNFSLEKNHKNELDKSRSIDKTVKKVLDNLLQLAKEDTINHIISVLKRARSSLKSLKVPKSELKPLTEIYGQGEFACIEELHVFCLNGLDQLLQLEEKKWTQEMLLSTAITTAMGVTQIAIGTVIELCSVGMMTHVGVAFVSEGVSDVFFATSTLKSGYFSWEDYRQHKIESIFWTAVTVGIGAYLSRGTKVSRFGYELAGPNFEVNGMKVATMTGTQLCNTAGYSKIAIGKEVVKRIISKAIGGIAFSLANAGVDALVENYLQSLCEGIASMILSDIEIAVEKHNISISLKEAYDQLGDDEAKKYIVDLTKSVFRKQSYAEEFSRIVPKIASAVTKGISEAIEKRSKTSNVLILPINAVSKIMTSIKSAAHIHHLIKITNNFLDNLDHKLKGRLKKHADSNHKHEVKRDYESFKKEITDQWKSLLREKASKVIALHFVSPVLKEGANFLVSYAGKKIQQVYQSYKEDGLFAGFEELKEEHKKKLQDERQCTSKTKNHITEKYQGDLLKLWMKTRNPRLLAAIVRENCPMDMLCVSACTKVIHGLLNQYGIAISGVTIIVEGDNGIRQKFSSTSEEAENVTISLKLKGNHFEFCGSSPLENNINSESNNDCLFDALSDAIPGLPTVITPEEFRAKAANFFEQDEGIRYHIQQGWHQLPVSLGAFGGAAARRRTRVVHDPDSSEYNDDLYPIFEDYQHRNRKVSDHLIARFNRLIRLSGMTQKVSEITNTGRDEVVARGSSVYQDQSSNRGSEIHAAHVVRAGEVNPEMKNQYEKLHDMMVNYLGHTQNVPKYANVWCGVGGKIDQFQSRNLTKLQSINFEGRLTVKDAWTIFAVKWDYITTLTELIKRETVSDRVEELRKAKETILTCTTESIFKMGKDGYNGKGMDRYQ